MIEIILSLAISTYACAIVDSFTIKTFVTAFVITAITLYVARLCDWLIDKE